MTKVQPFRFSTRKRKHADRAPTDNQGYRFHADAKAHTNFETRQTKRAAGNRKGVTDIDIVEYYANWN